MEFMKYKEGDFPVTEQVKGEELCLPQPRPRTPWELEYVSANVKEFYLHPVKFEKYTSGL
jgi:hypothetical protein